MKAVERVVTSFMTKKFFVRYRYLTLWYSVLPFASYTTQRLCMGTVLLCRAPPHMRTLDILFIAVPLITVVRSRECVFIPSSYTIYPDRHMIGMERS